MADVVFNPKVSIVIPVYNGSNYLENAIRCALSQTYQNLEVIVVNDGSTDDGATDQIARSFGDQIRYFSKPNGGVSSALNLGIREMTGDYFSWLSHDDAYTPEKVVDSVNALKAAGAMDGHTLAYCGGYHIDEKGRNVRPFSNELEIGKVYSGTEMVNYVCEHGTLNGCCMLIPKTVFARCGGFNESLRYSQDSLMWYQMFLQGFGMVYDGKPNVMYRLHASQTSHTRHELFEKDADAIAEILAPNLRKVSTKNNNLLYKYALRMAKYRCSMVVDTMQKHADAECAFSLSQKLKLRTVLLYGNVRGSLKNIYYRCVLRVKV